MEPMAEIRGRYVAALQFFLRLPLPDFIARHADHEAGLDRAAPLFGLVGLAIGGLLALAWMVLSGFLPPVLAAGATIALGIWITGGLHEDGFADCADGLGGATERSRILEILRDSRIGTYGAAALVFSIGLRWAALAGLTVAGGALALIVAHAVGRAAIAIALRFSSYARPQGTGSLVAAGISTEELAAGLAISAVVALLFGGFGGVVAAAAGLAAAAILLLGFEKRVGGYTGDTLGAMEQTAEIVVLVALAAIWRS